MNFALAVESSGSNVSFKVSDLQVTEESSENFNYYKPTMGHQCWNVELPCTDFLTYKHIRLRNPQVGIGGGFIRVNKSGSK